MDIIMPIVLKILANVVMALITAVIVMWLWNWLMPAVFGLAVITFWQAFGLNVLCAFLFKSN